MRACQSTLSATAARATFDAAASEICGIEQPRQLFLRQVRHLCSDVANRPAFLVSLLRDRGALVVTDDGVEGRDQNRVAIERLGESRLIHLEARDRILAESTIRAGEQTDALEK